MRLRLETLRAGWFEGFWLGCWSWLRVEIFDGFRDRLFFDNFIQKKEKRGRHCLRMVREIELSEELWRTRFLIELCYLDDRKIVWCVNMFSSNLSVTKVLSILQRWRMFDQNSQLSNFQLESLILAQNERWRQA